MRSSKNLYAVILAGGSGTRFWPVSRRSNPKQFLNFTGKGTLFQETLARIRPLIAGSRTFIVTNAVYRKTIEQQIKRFGIPKTNLLLEPSGKNTAPAIAWAAAKIQEIDPAAVMIVLPSDHLISKQGKFLQTLREAVRLAQEDYLVTLGIVPRRPETGYGYLKTVKMRRNGRLIVKVRKFTEKPSLPKAKQFLKNRNYFWNSGMFVWKCSAILHGLKAYLPQVYRLIGKKTGSAHIKLVWGRMPSISIDYGILEKAKNVVAVPAVGIGWSDLGSWESLAEISLKDKQGNLFRGDVIPVNCKNTFIWGQKKMIASIGLEGIVIIDTPDALLVCSRERSQDVKEIVNVLNAKKRKEI
jgi:mannose-1-phosphate guanylyltransferase